MDSRDKNGSSRFLYNPPQNYIEHLTRDDWFWSTLYYKSEARSGMDCCSDSAISFHHVSPHDFYMYEYLIYKLKPYGLIPNLEPLPTKLSPDSFKNKTLQIK